MNTDKKLRFFYASFVLINYSVYATETFQYVVKKGDCLTMILYQGKLVPVYGRNGSLNNFLGLNPHIKKRKNYTIYPGEVITFDGKLKTEVKNSVIENSPAPSSPDISGKTSELVMEKIIDLEKRLDKIEYSKSEKVQEIQESFEIESSSKEREVSLKEETKLNDQYFFVRLMPQVSWLKVSAISNTEFSSSNISALSKANLGILGNYGIKINEKWSISAFSYFSQVNFYKDSQLNVDKLNFIRAAYGVGFDYRLNESWTSNFRIGYFDEFYLEVPSVKTVNINITQTPEIHMGLRRDIKKIKNVSFDTAIFSKIILPNDSNNVKGKLGFGLGGDVLVRYQSKGLRFFYNYSQAKAASKSTETYELGWNLIFEEKFYD